MSDLPAAGSVDLQRGWRLASFGDTLIGGTRNGVYKPKHFHGRGAKIVNMGEIFSYGRLKSDVEMRRVQLNESELGRFRVAPGDLLFARRSLVAEGAGKCCVVLDVEEDTVFESSIIRASPDTRQADSLFLYYFFASPAGRHALGTIRRQTSVAGITGPDLVKLRLLLPPIGEQRRIATILGALDDRIELNRQMNRTLETMAQAIFKSWFIDFDGYDKLFKSSIGPVPGDWEVAPFDEIVHLIGGGTPSRREPAYWGGGVPWFSVHDAPSLHDIYVHETKETITDAGLARSSARLVREGTTIISARGTVGKLAVAGRPMAFNQSCYGVQPKKGHGDAFVYFLLRSLVSELQRGAHGSVFDTITRATFQTAIVAIPPVSLTDRFSEVVSPLLSRIDLNGRESRTLADLRDTLLPKLLSGEVRVRDAEQTVARAAS